ncbi:hypothetical protein J41TS4_15130 [Paenibacillus apis]|uniref:Uncharacterized protein n=1 Tax=Paenibacillus apis TaxID=1792174 RepID=A0A920CJP5_9BACL|nr:hypothetical protein J41TS4_15130 [Paenibacillus apis]
MGQITLCLYSRNLDCLSPALKNGWKVEIPNGKKPIVVRIMNEGSGGRTQPYFRVSIDGKRLLYVGWKTD